MSRQMIIATHDGIFHVDEVLAIFMLMQLPEYKDAKVIRTRDKELLKTADVLVDVGNVYDHSKRRYDHHQKDFNYKFKKQLDVTMSSAGLIYKHFGLRVICKMLNITKDHPDIYTIYHMIYHIFIILIDASDNGIEYKPSNRAFVNKRHINPSTLLARITPSWYEDNSVEVYNRLFPEALKIIGDEFIYRLHYIIYDWLPSKQIFENSIESRFEIHPSGKIMVVNRFCTWDGHLHKYEYYNKDVEIHFVICKSSSGEHWKLYAVKTLESKYKYKSLIDERLRNESTEIMSLISGIPDIVFVHKDGHNASIMSKESAIQLAILSLEKNVNITSPQSVLSTSPQSVLSTSPQSVLSTSPQSVLSTISNSSSLSNLNNMEDLSKWASSTGYSKMYNPHKSNKNKYPNSRLRKPNSQG
ncbi:MAG: MYG1 family protein [Cetobacterium sp.]